MILGPDGGQAVVDLGARFRLGRTSVGLSVPIGTWLVPGKRSAALGNLGLQVRYRLDQEGWSHELFAQAHFDVGSPAWTWIHRADELWPGWGGDLGWEVRTDGDLAFLGRATVGFHGARGYDPYPSSFVRVGLAAGVDYSFLERLGVTGEVFGGWWSPSPLEISALFRVDPVRGLRLRTGFVLPVGVWAGLSPVIEESGAREATWLLELSLAM